MRVYPVVLIDTLCLGPPRVETRFCVCVELALNESYRLPHFYVMINYQRPVVVNAVYRQLLNVPFATRVGKRVVRFRCNVNEQRVRCCVLLTNHAYRSYLRLTHDRCRLVNLNLVSECERRVITGCTRLEVLSNRFLSAVECVRPCLACLLLNLSSAHRPPIGCGTLLQNRCLSRYHRLPVLIALRNTNNVNHRITVRRFRE